MRGALVTGVNPGGIRTERWDGILAKWGAAKGITPEEAERDILKSVPLRRPGTAEEVANLVVFLASERASFVTGAAISMDGAQRKAVMDV